MSWSGSTFHSSHPKIYLFIWNVVVGVRDRKISNDFWLIWHAVILKTRNDMIFKNSIKIVDEMVDKIKVLSWR